MDKTIGQKWPRWIGSVVLATALFLPCSADATQLSATSAPTILSVTETSSGTTTSLTANLSVSVSDGAVYSGTGTSRSLSNVVNITGQIPAETDQTYSTTSAAAAAVGTLVQGGIGQIAQNVKAAETSGPLSGVVQTVFTYSVPVTINSTSGSSTKGVVNDTCFILPDGEYSCLGASYSSNIEYILFALYSQGAVAAGLPTTWTMPNAGQLQWALLEIQDSGTAVSQAFVSVSGSTWHTINLLKTGGPIGQYGEYDQFQVATVNISGTNTQVLVNCSADANSTCSTYQAGSYVLDPNNTSGVGAIGYDPQMPVDMLVQNEVYPLQKEYGANSSVLLYGTTVKPVYTGTGSTQTAVVAVNVQTRVITSGQRFFFISPGAPGKFTESGTYGYMLNQQVDEYQIDSSGTPQYVTTFSQQVVSPTETFNKAVTLTTGQTIGASDIINPFPSGDQIYSYLNDTINNLPASDYVYVAPITYQ